MISLPCVSSPCEEVNAASRRRQQTSLHGRDQKRLLHRSLTSMALEKVSPDAVVRLVNFRSPYDVPDASHLASVVLVPLVRFQTTSRVTTRYRTLSWSTRTSPGFTSMPGVHLDW